MAERHLLSLRGFKHAPLSNSRPLPNALDNATGRAYAAGRFSVPSASAHLLPPRGSVPSGAYGCQATARMVDRGSNREKEVRDARKVPTVSRGETAKGRGAKDQKRGEAEEETGEEGERSADRGDRARRAGTESWPIPCRKPALSPCLVTRVGRVCQSLGAFARSRPQRSCLSWQVRPSATA